MQRLSGLTLEPSTADAFVDKWMASWAASPARTSPSPASAWASPASVPDCGGSSPGLFAKFNPAGSLSKTSPQFSLWDRDEPYSENLPVSGSMRSGQLFERPMSAPVTNATGPSFWPTAATDSFRSRSGDRADEMGLDQQARFWATPNARDVKNPGAPDGDREQRKHEAGWTVDLNDQGVRWPTPTVRDWKAETGLENRKEFHGPSLSQFVYLSSLPAPATPAGPPSSAITPDSRPVLNAAFVEWLMGLPSGWTAYAPLATQSYRSRLRRLLDSWLEGRG
jgi:hypothetical protein